MSKFAQQILRRVAVCALLCLLYCFGVGQSALTPTWLDNGLYGYQSPQYDPSGATMLVVGSNEFDVYKASTGACLAHVDVNGLVAACLNYVGTAVF
jgi:hypothetical protein